MALNPWRYVALTGVTAFLACDGLACGGNAQTFSDPYGPGAVGPTGTVVGAPCTTDTQCRFKCKDGACTVPCRSDLDCPVGSLCIDDDGGICAVTCRSTPDCAGIGTPTFVCKEKDRKGFDGKATVCRKP